MVPPPIDPPGTHVVWLITTPTGRCRAWCHHCKWSCPATRHKTMSDAINCASVHTDAVILYRSSTLTVVRPDPQLGIPA